MRIGGCRAAVVLAAVLAGCGGQGNPKPPSPPAEEGPIPLNGRENLEWDQEVAGDVDLSRYRFAAYVDSRRIELPSAACRAEAPGRAVCRSPFPPMSAGMHVLTFVSYIVPDNVESGHSAPPLTVVVSSSVTASAEAGDEIAPSQSETATDCAVAPLADGNAVAAFPTGELRFLDTRRSGSTSFEWSMPEGAWTLRAAAVHSEFSNNRWMYVLLSDRADESRLALVRYRELNSVLGERAMVATFSHRIDRGRPRLRFGPDNKLYLALLSDTSAIAGTLGHTAGELHAFVMRLNDDGTVPADNPGGRAFLELRATSPTAFDWDPVTGELWIVEQWDREHSIARQGIARGSPIALAPHPHSIPVGLGVVRTRNAPAVERLWTFFSDGLARELEVPGGISGDAREFVPGAPHEIYDALLTPEGDVLSCGTTPDGRHFVQRSIWR